MAGHSKWANIQHRKGRVDAQRGKAFTKLVREITVAARSGGPDPDANARLRAAIIAARRVSMPSDNINRAIEKGTGGDSGADLEELLYEGYGPGGVAFLVAAMTDNKNRTTPEIRHFFSKYGGNLGETGSVAWQFEKRGFIRIPKSAKTEDELTELLLEIGAEDYEDNDEFWGILTSADDLHAVREALEKAGVDVESAKWDMFPTNEIAIEGDTLAKVAKMVEAFEDHDDVQDVWNNADFDEADLV